MQINYAEPLQCVSIETSCAVLKQAYHKLMHNFWFVSPVSRTRIRAKLNLSSCFFTLTPGEDGTDLIHSLRSSL